MNEFEKFMEYLDDDSFHLGQFLDYCFRSTDISLFWKDKDLIICGCNQQELSIFRFNKRSHIIGKTDFDLCFTDEEAQKFRDDDAEVIKTKKGKSSYIEEQHRYDRLPYIVSVTKIPWTNKKGDVEGVIGYFSEIKNDIYSINNWKDGTQKIIDSIESGNNFCIVINNDVIHLTKKQAKCLFYVSTGKTAKQIGNLMDCSHRTVEQHIITLKRKFSVFFLNDLADIFWKNKLKIYR